MDKQQKYSEARKYIENLLLNENDSISMMSTIVCVLKDHFPSFSWVGFYRVVDKKILKIGPYQGPRGCIEISYDRGVCGKCATEQKVQNVPDVSIVKYHIACSNETKSEIVVPVFNKDKKLIAVLDVDSSQINNFDDVDKENLEAISELFMRIKSKDTIVF